MVPLAVIVAAVLGQDPQKRTFPEQNHLGEALLFDGANPTFRERIHGRALGRERNRFHAAACQRRMKRGTELRVAIVQNITARMKIASSALRRTAANLVHPVLIWMSRDSGHAHAAAL